MEKNVKAIDKIIAELARRDWQAAVRKLTTNQKRKLATGAKRLSDYGGYTLSTETMEAREIKLNYLNDEIGEEEYKAWCLKWNLAHVL